MTSAKHYNFYRRFKTKASLMKNIVLLSTLIMFGIAACVQPPNYSVEPEIEFVSVSKSEVLQAIDTFRINFSYTDGDGDIGGTSGNNNVIITDSRTGFEETFNVPDIPQQGVSNGISGEISLLVFASCCLNSNPICLPTPNANPEEITYTIRMFDKAGNISNTIQTSPISLICD